MTLHGGKWQVGGRAGGRRVAMGSPGAHSLGGGPRQGRREFSPIDARPDRTWQTPAVFQHGGEGGRVGTVG